MSASARDDARNLPLADLMEELADGQDDVSSNLFARTLFDRYGYTVEHAKAIIYALVDDQRIIITDRFRLRPHTNRT